MCNDVTTLSEIEVNVTEIWPGFEELDVNIVGPAGQTLVELDAQNTTVDLSSVQ